MDRLAAREVAADVGRGPAVERDPILEERHRLAFGSADTARTRWGRKPAPHDVDEGRRGRVRRVADDRHLGDRGDREVERDEPLGEERRMTRRDLDDAAEGTFGCLAIPGLSR